MPTVAKVPKIKVGVVMVFEVLGKKKPTTDEAKTILEISRRYLEIDSNWLSKNFIIDIVSQFIFSAHEL